MSMMPCRAGLPSPNIHKLSAKGPQLNFAARVDPQCAAKSNGTQIGKPSEPARGLSPRRKSCANSSRVAHPPQCGVHAAIPPWKGSSDANSSKVRPPPQFDVHAPLPTWNGSSDENVSKVSLPPQCDVMRTYHPGRVNPMQIVRR